MLQHRLWQRLGGGTGAAARRRGGQAPATRRRMAGGPAAVSGALCELERILDDFHKLLL